MKILILSRVVWNENNSFGNTYTTFFKGMANIEIANIYCAYGIPNTDIANRFYCMNEKTIINNILDPKSPSGFKIMSDATQYSTSIEDDSIIKKAQNRKWQLFYWVRELIWKTGKWRSKDLDDFIRDFNPDIIFSPFYYSVYMNDIKNYLKTKYNLPVVSFVSDDIYSYKQFNLSPLFWIDRYFKRKIIKYSADKNEFIYVISEKQKIEYIKTLHNDCRILYKGANFEKTVEKRKVTHPLIISYTGNVSSGRWKIIAILGKIIKDINKDGEKIVLNVYTTTPLNKKMMRAMQIDKAVYLNAPLKPSEIEKTQLESDILLHCESFNLREKLQVRLSFSTKIVDYFSRRRCILAIGDKNIASIRYLLDNDAAIVATTKEEIRNKIMAIIENKHLIDTYAEKAWECGVKNHQIKNIQKKLFDDLKEVINNKIKSED